VGRWDQNGSWGDWLGGCGLHSTGSGQGPVAGCCECGDEPSGSCATELVNRYVLNIFFEVEVEGNINVCFSVNVTNKMQGDC
jgi:hypothetical protein